MNSPRRQMLWMLAIALVLAPAAAFDATGQQATPAPAPAPKQFTEAELASLLAPIALYPDTVISQILMASTYPLEVVEASRFMEKNKSLKGDALSKEVQKQSWDESVQALCAMPDVLKMMDDRLDWTQDVGDAFLAQQSEIMEMIQTLRQKAKAEGNLKSDDHLKVSTQPAPSPTPGATTPTETKTEVIVIESANPEVVYVPTYSSTVVYGSWGYPAYPPYYWPPPMGYPGSGFWYGMGVGISIGIWGDCWDDDIDWNGGDINIDNDINIGDGERGDRGDRGDRGESGAGAKDRSGDRAGATDRSGNRSGTGASASDRGGQKWSHNPDHRKGVSYRDNATASKFDRASTGSASRDSYRGRDSASASNRAGTGSSARTSDFRSGSGGASAGTRDIGSSSRGTGSTSAGSRDVGSSNRAGTSSSSRSSMSSSSRSSSRSGSSSAFGGMSSGSRASSYGSRGGMSRGGGGGRRR